MNLKDNRKLSWQDKALQDYLAENPDLKAGNKNFRNLAKAKTFREFLGRQFLNAKEQFTLCSMIQVVCEVLVLFFLGAIFRGIYVINFSIDALVAVAALVILISNLLAKYRLLRQYGPIKDELLLDLSALALCIMLKLWLPPNIDFSLAILIVSYFIQKRRFQNRLDQLKKEYRVL